MQKYNILMAVSISLLLSACGNMKNVTGETDSVSIVSESKPQNQIEPTQQDPFSQEIIFQSSAIERRTRELLEKPEGTITKEDVLAITEFSLDNSEDVVCEKPFLDLQWYRNLQSVTLRDCGVQSLEGAEALTALKKLSVDNYIVSDISVATDISALSSLTQLEELSLNNCQLSDISPLKNCRKLEKVSLRKNQITDITPLYGLDALKEIDLKENNLSETELKNFYEAKSSTPITVTQTGKLREDMPEFTFVLTAFYDLQSSCYALQTVDVYQGDALLQTISIPELTLFGQTYIMDSLQDTLGFELEDVNFDGYQDIRLFDTLNGNYRTEWVYLVWNPAEQQFQHDSRLNQISLATFDQEKQLIHGMERSGAVCHYLSTYQYIDGEIVKIHYYEEEGLVLSNEQIKQYYDTASVKTSGVSFDAWYEHTLERNAASGELETVCEEYVFVPYDSDGKQIENKEEELHVDVSSALGAKIREALPSYQK